VNGSGSRYAAKARRNRESPNVASGCKSNSQRWQLHRVNSEPENFGSSRENLDWDLMANLGHCIDCPG
jgi:hypothetical protein